MADQTIAPGGQDALVGYPSSGRGWVKIGSSQEAHEEGRRMQHAVAPFYDMMSSAGADFYSLREKDGSPLVTAMVNNGRVEIAVGEGNSNPFTRYARHLSDLGEATNAIVDERSYPYRGMKMDLRVTEHGDQGPVIEQDRYMRAVEEFSQSGAGTKFLARGPQGTKWVAASQTAIMAEASHFPDAAGLLVRQSQDPEKQIALLRDSEGKSIAAAVIGDSKILMVAEASDGKGLLVDQALKQLAAKTGSSTAEMDSVQAQAQFQASSYLRQLVNGEGDEWKHDPQEASGGRPRQKAMMQMALTAYEKDPTAMAKAGDAGLEKVAERMARAALQAEAEDSAGSTKAKASDKTKAGPAPSSRDHGRS